MHRHVATALPVVVLTTVLLGLGFVVGFVAGRSARPVVIAAGPRP